MFSYVETFVLHDRDVLRSIARVDVDLVWGLHYGDVAARGVTSGRPCLKNVFGCAFHFHDGVSGCAVELDAGGRG